MKMNPYITKINSQIVKKLFPKDKSHIALEDDIALDYEKINCFQEDFFVNGYPVENTYNSSLGRVYVSSFKPKGNFLDLSVDFNVRMEILKSLSTRYLIVAALDKYLNLKPINFKTEKGVSSFEIENIYFENEACEIKEILEKAIPVYISSALDMKNYYQDEEGKVLVNGIYKGDYICPHLANLSEIDSFSVDHYAFNSVGLAVYYNN